MLGFGGSTISFCDVPGWASKTLDPRVGRALAHGSATETLAEFGERFLHPAKSDAFLLKTQMGAYPVVAQIIEEPTFFRL